MILCVVIKIETHIMRLVNESTISFRLVREIKYVLRCWDRKLINYKRTLQCYLFYLFLRDLTGFRLLSCANYFDVYSGNYWTYDNVCR